MTKRGVTTESLPLARAVLRALLYHRSYDCHRAHHASARTRMGATGTARADFHAGAYFHASGSASPDA